MIAIFDEDGSGTVDFQEFIAGLSAFSSKGNRDEKLKCTFLALCLQTFLHILYWSSVLISSCIQGVRYG